MKYRENPSEPWKEYYIKALDSMVIGSIIQFVGATIPVGWLECDGSTITQSAYPELYVLIGGTLPDFRGRVLVGQDTNDSAFDTLLETGGSKELQQHSHGNLWQVGSGGGTGTGSYDGMPSVLGSYAIPGMTSWNTKNAGTGNSGNLQPYAVVKHIIKATNTTPTMASVVNTTNSSTTDAYSCDYVNDLVDYSTTEIKTGAKWIDGKPIYRKVLLASKSDFSSSNHLYAIPNNVSNLENYIHIEARLKRTGDIWNEIPNGFGTTSANSWSTTINDILKSTISIQIGENVYNYLETDNSVIVIIEYTKTTD